MAIKIACPRCGTAFNLTDALACQSVRCRECQEVFDVTQNDPRETPISALVSVQPHRAIPDVRHQRQPRSLLGVVVLGVAGLCLAGLLAGIVYVYAIQASGQGPAGNPVVSSSGSQDTSWIAPVDPAPDRPVPAQPDGAGISVASAASVVFPTTSAPYAAVKQPSENNLFQVYDLLKSKPLGKPQRLDLPGSRMPILSPTGHTLAWLTKAVHPTVEVRRVDTGKTVRIPVAESETVQLLMVDFLARDRLLTVSRLMEKGPVGVFGTYRTWDLASGKKELEFAIPVLPHPRQVTLSLGRNHLVMLRSASSRTQHAPQGHWLSFWDLSGGTLSGSIEMEGLDTRRGECASLAFSLDGRHIAMLWRLNEKPMTWGRLICWDVSTRKKICDHTVGYLLPQIDSLWSAGGKRSLQWLPDGSGWLLFGHLIVRRSDGALVGKLPPEPKNEREIVERVFLGRGHVTHFIDGKTPHLSFLTLPRGGG
jgi:hypothetical protein